MHILKIIQRMQETTLKFWFYLYANSWIVKEVHMNPNQTMGKVLGNLAMLLFFKAFLFIVFTFVCIHTHAWKSWQTSDDPYWGLGCFSESWLATCLCILAVVFSSIPWWSFIQYLLGWALLSFRELTCLSYPSHGEIFQPFWQKSNYNWFLNRVHCLWLAWLKVLVYRLS